MFILRLILYFIGSIVYIKLIKFKILTAWYSTFEFIIFNLNYQIDHLILNENYPNKRIRFWRSVIKNGWKD